MDIARQVSNIVLQRFVAKQTRGKLHEMRTRLVTLKVICNCMSKILWFSNSKAACKQLSESETAAFRSIHSHART